MPATPAGGGGEDGGPGGALRASRHAGVGGVGGFADSLGFRRRKDWKCKEWKEGSLERMELEGSTRTNFYPFCLGGFP